MYSEMTIYISEIRKGRREAQDFRRTTVGRNKKKKRGISRSTLEE